jgi:hypothetical protein
MLARPWSAVVRVPTPAGDVWFKELPPSLAFEPALTLALGRRFPDRVPEVIAAEGSRLLTRDAGRRLRNVHDEGGDAPPWNELLPLYAELQIELAAETDNALALGAPDRRPERLVALAQEMPGWEDAADRILRTVAGLGGSVPATVVHEEATDGNLFVRDGRVRLIDWGEASISHPFTGALLPLRVATERGGDPERLRDLYLEPFSRFAPIEALRDSFAHAYQLAPVVRAAGWHETLVSHDRAVSVELGDPVAAWREVFDGIAAGTITLGEA